MTQPNDNDPAKPLDQLSAKELGDMLTKQLKGSLDERDSKLIETLTNILTKKVQDEIAEFERRHAAHRVPGLADDAKEVKDFSFSRLMRHIVTKGAEKADLEVALCKEAEYLKKDLSTTIDTAGGFIVPPQVMAAQMIPLLTAKVIALQLGMRRMSGLSGSPVLIPKLTGGTTAYWVGENTAVTKSDPAFGQIEMTPHAVASLVKMSNRFLAMSQPAADTIIKERMAGDIGLKIDIGALNCTGSNGQPTGVLQTTGIQTVTSFGSAAASTAYNKLIDMITKLDVANASVGTLGWAMHPTVLGHLRQMADPTDNSQPKERRLFDTLPIAGNNLLGYKFLTSTQLPTDQFIFANWADAWLGEWGSMVLRSSDTAGAAFENMQTFILCAMEVDICIAHTESFCAATGVS